eukprot:CAMPEP_0174751372 /NCGR_PEP_ID=MMETSP1094-20130205/99690_1 /TAXON_ID=156173 /ORGANISM="Chrysochromulina brevifilum, Strain UTEX LB 985" /LENGTH=74 /DNA_ID=CAMNT_0015956859 /DNA_START=3 /DNA_END=227 /DNA_ORIENTATION=+
MRRTQKTASLSFRRERDSDDLSCCPSVRLKKRYGAIRSSGSPDGAARKPGAPSIAPAGTLAETSTLPPSLRAPL